MISKVNTLREFVKSIIRGIYTVTMVRVKEVNEEDRRAVVALKSNDNILIDNVPIASPFATDGAGMIVPVERGDEGLVLHAQEPLEQQIQQRGEQDPESERRFQLEDAVLLPMLWLDEDDVPDHEAGEFQIAIQDGSVLRMLPNGEVSIEHPEGHEFRMDDDGIHLDGPVYINGQQYDEHTHDASYSWGDDAGSGTLTTDPPTDS